MANLDEIDFEVANEDLDKLKELKQREEDMAEWSERDKIMQFIKNKDYALAIQLNNGLKLFGSIQMVGMTKCPFKMQIWELYELLGFLEVELGDYTDKKEFKNWTNETDFLQFICENDCQKFFIKPKKHTLISFISKYQSSISIEFKKMEFSISTMFSKVQWQRLYISNLLEKLETILNINTDQEPENNELPF